MLLIIVLVCTLSAARVLAGWDLQSRHRHGGLTTAPTGAATSRTFAVHRQSTPLRRLEYR